MPVESWTLSEDVPALAAQAMARIDAVLDRLDAAEREAFWSSIAKCYNTPYNDPEPRGLLRVGGIAAPVSPPGVDDEPPAADLASLAAIPHPAAFAPEHHAS